jgi:hypothetical protein
MSNGSDRENESAVHHGPAVNDGANPFRSYALVEDVPATWERYEAVARSLDGGPRGLLLHVAGPTDEGFRIIEVWESEAARRQFERDRAGAVDEGDFGVGYRAVVRELRAEHVVVGEAWPGRLEPNGHRSAEERGQ